MIPIAKSAAIPAPLKGPSSRGGKATRKLIEAQEAGTVLPDFRSDLYGHEDVRNQLFIDQHDKCAFCESPVAATMYGDVEHFRPKGGWVQNDGDALTQPGYYWLAYEWSNLLISCQLCNQEFKKNRFPLLNPKQRAKTHKHDIAREKPFLVNPSVEDPSKFIEFREYLPVGIDSEGRGAETIRILGLDREAMNTLRRDHMQTMKRMVRAIRAMEQIEQTPDIVEAMRELNLQIAEWVSDNAQYAAMCRAIFRAPIDR